MMPQPTPLVSISIVTPWRDHADLIRAYELSVRGAEVIVVDNNSTVETFGALSAMVTRLNGRHLLNPQNESFAHSNNQGLAVATGEIVMFLNNDIEATPGWLNQVARDVQPGALYGPSLGARVVAGQALAYIEGWCIAARRDTWAALGGWDAEAYPGLYWEDNDLCFRAMQLGLKLIKTDWAVRHFSNTTSATTPGAYDHSARQRAIFEERVRHAR